MNSNETSSNDQFFFNYNLKRHFELLTLKNEEKLITNELNIKLLAYSTVVVSYIKCLTRSQYLNILNSFLNKEISIAEFRTQFVHRREQNRQVMKILQKNLIILPAH